MQSSTSVSIDEVVFAAGPTVQRYLAGEGESSFSEAANNQPNAYVESMGARASSGGDFRLASLGAIALTVEVRQTGEYRRWFESLVDRRARARVDARIRRLVLGNLGDHRGVGEGVIELRIDYGPGYRVYLMWSDPCRVILLVGGDKHSQRQDVRRALQLARRV